MQTRSLVSAHHNAVTLYASMVAFHQRGQTRGVVVIEDNPGFAQAYKNVNPGGHFNIREYSDIALQNEYLLDPVAGAERLWRRIEKRRDLEWADSVQGICEIDSYNWVQFQQQAIFEKRMAELAGGADKTYAACSWGVGHPPHYWEEGGPYPWENFKRHYYPVFELPNVIVNLHEYNWPAIDDSKGVGSLILRFPSWLPRVRQELGVDLKCIIGEGWMDGGVAGRSGYGHRMAGLTPLQYLEAVKWIDAEYQATGLVLFTTKFCWGTHDAQWIPFEWIPPEVNLIEQYLIEQQAPVPIEHVWDEDLVDWLPKNSNGRRYGTKPGPSDTWVVHHVGVDIDASTVEIMRRTAAYHISKHNWAGIGYQYGVGEDGLITRNQTEETESAHCRGHNDHSVGVVLPGDLRDRWPTPAQLASLERLVASRPDWAVVGHKDMAGAATACPGTWIDEWLAGQQPPLPPDCDAYIQALEYIGAIVKETLE